MNRYIIIGNGTAAVGCIEGIRSNDSEGSIIVISQENHAVYCRPLISYFLEDRTNIEKMNYRASDFYQKSGCTVIYGKTAVKIDTVAKQVFLDDATALPYTKLCVTTGSSPFIPNFEGIENVNNKFTFMTIDDAIALKKTITKESKVLIIGAGLIGLKCAEGLHDKAGSITVCDLADRVLSSILDNDCAAIMQKHLEENNISFLLRDTAVKFEKNTAIMKSGKKINFDILVLAVGVKPNTDIIKNASGKIGRGIIVNEFMETSLTDIYAAGDCSESLDASSESMKIMALMPNAYMQGHTAGVNMGGGNRKLNNMIPMNSIGFFGLHAMTAGSCFGEYIEENNEGYVKRFYINNGYLTGFMLVGKTERAGIYTSLIREKTPISEINFDMLKKVATSAAFSTEIRKKKFGGVI